MRYRAMHITHSAIQMQSSHLSLEMRQQQESLTRWRDGPQGREHLHMAQQNQSLRLETSQHQFRLEQGTPAPHLRNLDQSLPQRMRELMPADPALINRAHGNPASHISAGTAELEADEEMETGIDLKLLLFKRFIERLTGQEIKLFDPAELQRKDKIAPLELPQASRPGDLNDGVLAWGMSYRFEETIIEMERSEFFATGLIHTADGMEIAIDLSLFMSRDYIAQHQLSIDMGTPRLKDPLVINFNGHSAELTQTRYAFDLNADGILNQIHFVGPNSGFLALDHNGDGMINDGSELFGALTGNGFTELEKYDEDGNGWIDAGDAIFDQLLIWSKDEHGNDRLETLAERGIGAIYLGHTDTPFSLKDNQNQLQGQIRSSGIYLHHNGLVGNVQQLDLVV